jgi:predicted PurR-regulated permease PerM
MSSIHKLPKTAPPPPPVRDAPEVSLFDDLNAKTVSLVVIALGVTIFLLNYMQALLAPLAFGMLLFYALDPRWTRWNGAGCRAGCAAALMIFLTLGIIVGGAYALQDQALTVINELPSGARRASRR